MRHGVVIGDTWRANYNTVAGNIIGMDVFGTSAAVPNGRSGVLIANGSKSNVIGTNGDGRNDEGERNWISGNARHGVEVSGIFSIRSKIAGNYIGTDLLGSTAIGNRLDGVFLEDGNNLVGTDGDGVADFVEGNVISGNGSYGVNSHGGLWCVIAGNVIGAHANSRRRWPT